jgi:hypothetical protein
MKFWSRSAQKFSQQQMSSSEIAIMKIQGTKSVSMAGERAKDSELKSLQGLNLFNQ